MPTREFFSSSYRQARDRFLETCGAVRASMTAYDHPLEGPEGEALAIDVVRIGSETAPYVLIVSSGTHGIEGFCGSGIQLGLLRTGFHREVPRDVVLLLVHALNPHGFAHLRRVNEDNVDLNRNFVDHDASPPPNPGYDELHPLLVPRDWHGPAHEAADLGIVQLMNERGFRALQAAVTLGQYAHADGLFYGGTRPVWSNRTWRSIVRTHVVGHERVAFIDLHSGLGPYGYGEPIFRGAFGPGHFERAREWWGPDVTSSEEGTSSSTPIAGNIARGLAEELSGTELTAITLEFGTLSAMEVLNAMRGDHWLHGTEDARPDVRRAIEADMRAAFFCDSDDWKERVWARARDLIGRAALGLATPASRPYMDSGEGRGDRKARRGVVGEGLIAQVT